MKKEQNERESGSFFKSIPDKKGNCYEILAPVSVNEERRSSHGNGESLNKVIDEFSIENAEKRFEENSPSKLIQKIMKGKSKLEMLKAESNFKRYIELAESINNRLMSESSEKEILKNETEIVTKNYPQPVHNNPIQNLLF